MERVVELAAEAEALRQARGGDTAVDRSTLPLDEVRAATVAALPKEPDDLAVATLDAGVLRVGAPGRKRKIVLIHGGGFLVGDQRAMLPLAASLVRSLGVTVYLPRYRFAPEQPLEVIVADATDGVRVAIADGDASIPVTVMGHSAGAYLAARSGWELSGLHPIDTVVLLAPMLYPDMTSPSLDEWATGQLLTRNEVEWFWSHTLGEPPNEPPLIETFLPEDPPNVLIVTAGQDPLRDDGARLAERLTAHGVAMRYVCMEATLHNQLNGQMPVAREVVTALVATFLEA